MKTLLAQAPCPCGSGAQYGACCGPLHGGDVVNGPFAVDAHRLMRARYSAFVLENAAFLLTTWEPSQRPATLDFEPDLKWLGLEVRSYATTARGEAEVEFVARCKPAQGPAVRLHERSRFTYDGLQWLYVDGDPL